MIELLYCSTYWYLMYNHLVAFKNILKTYVYVFAWSKFSSIMSFKSPFDPHPCAEGSEVYIKDPP